MVETALYLGETNEDLSSSADALHKTSNLATSCFCFAEDGKEMDKSEKITCRVCKDIVFSH